MKIEANVVLMKKERRLKYEQNWQTTSHELTI